VKRILTLDYLKDGVLEDYAIRRINKEHYYSLKYKVSSSYEDIQKNDCLLKIHD